MPFPFSVGKRVIGDPLKAPSTWYDLRRFELKCFVFFFLFISSCFIGKKHLLLSSVFQPVSSFAEIVEYDSWRPSFSRTSGRAEILWRHFREDTTWPKAVGNVFCWETTTASNKTGFSGNDWIQSEHKLTTKSVKKVSELKFFHCLNTEGCRCSCHQGHAFLSCLTATLYTKEVSLCSRDFV